MRYCCKLLHHKIFISFILCILAMLVVCVCLLWYKLRTNEIFLTFLLNHQCTYLFDYQYDFVEKNGRIPNWHRPPSPSPFVKVFRRILGNEKVVFVGLRNLDITQLPDVLRQTATLPYLQHLIVQNCDWSQSATLQLQQHRKLKVVDLRKANISKSDRILLTDILPNVIIFACPSVSLSSDCEPTGFSKPPCKKWETIVSPGPSCQRICVERHSCP